MVCPHVIKFLDFLFLYLSSSYIWLKSSYGWSPLLEQYEKIEPKKYCFIWVIFGKRVCKWLFWCYVLLINILYFSIFVYVDKYFINGGNRFCEQSHFVNIYIWKFCNYVTFHFSNALILIFFLLFLMRICK